MLKFRPLAKIQEYLEFSQIKEPKEEITAIEDMLFYLRDNFVGLEAQIKKVSKTARYLEDEVTADLMVKLMTAFDKRKWFVESMLTKTKARKEGWDLVHN